MVYDILPTENLEYQDVRDTLNSANGSVTNDVASAFKESANINMLAKYKPIDYPEKLISLEDYDFKNKQYGLNIPSLTSITSAQIPSAPWTYNLPTSVFRLADFRKYNKNAVPPILFYFPEKLTIGNVIGIGGLNEFDVAFNDLGHGNYDVATCIDIFELVDLDRTNKNYRVCLGLFIERNGTKTSYFLTDKKSLKEKRDDRDYGTIDVNTEAIPAGTIKMNDVITAAFFLTDNDIYNGSSYLPAQANFSLEYELNVHKRTYTVEYMSLSNSIEVTLTYSLKSYYDGSDGYTHYYIDKLNLKIIKDSTLVGDYFFVNLVGEMAGDKSVTLREDLKVEFEGDTFERAYTSNDFGEVNDFILYDDRDQFTCSLIFEDKINQYTEILASESVDVYK